MKSVQFTVVKMLKDVINDRIKTNYYLVETL